MRIASLARCCSAVLHHPATAFNSARPLRLRTAIGVLLLRTSNLRGQAHTEPCTPQWRGPHVAQQLPFIRSQHDFGRSGLGGIVYAGRECERAAHTGSTDLGRVAKKHGNCGISGDVGAGGARPQTVLRASRSTAPSAAPGVTCLRFTEPTGWQSPSVHTTGSIPATRRPFSMPPCSSGRTGAEIAPT